MDYVFTSRSIRSGKFSNEPGATHFLSIPSTADDVDTAHKSTKTQWVKDVQALACPNPGVHAQDGNIVIYVHGFNNSTADMLSRHRKIKARLEALNFNGIVVSYDWPSANTALNYLEDRKDAKLTALKLVDDGISTFAALQRPDCRINVHVLAHSMGCFVVREAFDDADDRPAVAARSWSVSQVLLVAGDISAGSMSEGNSKSSSIYRHCNRLTNYYNPMDEVLTVSNAKRIGVAPRVGRIGLPDSVPRKAVDIYCGAYFKAHQDNFPSGISTAHTWYFDDPNFLEDVFHTLNGALDRNEIPTRAPTNTGGLALKP
ncbi:MAG: alpha/beta hydrolase [Pseudomonadota bacterium]